MPDVKTPTPRHIHGDGLPDAWDLPLRTTGVCSCGRSVFVGMSDGPWPGRIWRVRRWWHRPVGGSDPPNLPVANRELADARLAYASATQRAEMWKARAEAGLDALPGNRVARVKCSHREGLAYVLDDDSLGCLPCLCNDPVEVLEIYEYTSVTPPAEGRA